MDTKDRQSFAGILRRLATDIESPDFNVESIETNVAMDTPEVTNPRIDTAVKRMRSGRIEYSITATLVDLALQHRYQERLSGLVEAGITPAS